MSTLWGVANAGLGEQSCQAAYEPVQDINLLLLEELQTTSWSNQLHHQQQQPKQAQEAKHAMQGRGGGESPASQQPSVTFDLTFHWFHLTFRDLHNSYISSSWPYDKYCHVHNIYEHL